MLASDFNAKCSKEQTKMSIDKGFRRVDLLQSSAAQMVLKLLLSVTCLI